MPEDGRRRRGAGHHDWTRVLAGWRGGPFGVDMTGEVLLPGQDACIGATTVEPWLDAQAR